MPAPTVESALKLVTKAGAPLVPLTVLEQALMLGPQVKHGLSLYLHFNGNDIAAEVSRGPSGVAVVVFDEEFNPGRAEACANILRNRSGSATATFFMGSGTCVVGGNTIVNESAIASGNVQTSEGPPSLFVDVFASKSLDMMAVAGNCLGGRVVVIPANRPEVSPPRTINAWPGFNGIF